MKKLTTLLLGTMFTINSFAQAGPDPEKNFMADPFAHPMLPYFITFVLLAVTVVLVALVAIYVLKIVSMLTEQLKKEYAEKLGIPYIATPGWWDRFTEKMNASVPVENEKEIELEHSYDGIKELDNHLPPWWKWLFYGTIGWSFIYLIVFHFSDSLPLSDEEYQIELAQAEEQAQKLRASQPEAMIDETALQYTADAAILENGKNVFNNNPCGSCHRADGGGNTIGPNLTDEYWLHGGDIRNIFKTIKYGAVDKGMPAWGKAMSAKDLRDVTFYIMSLQGSNPPDAKASQGEIHKQTITVNIDTIQTQAAL